MAKKTKNILVRLDDDMLQKLNDIKDYIGFVQTSDTMRFCISTTLKKLIPDYVKVQRASTPEDRARVKVATMEAKTQMKEEREKDRIARLLKELDAKVLDNGMCEYKTYEYVNPNILPFVGSRKIAISELTNDHVAKQYSGASKEVILEALNNNKNE